MRYVFTDSQARDYADVDGSSLHAEPDQTFELSSAPDDGRWAVEVPVTAPESPVAPATAQPDVSTGEAA